VRAIVLYVEPIERWSFVALVGVDNSHIFRHSFTVEETDIDVELPALQAVRVPIDLAAGTYTVICDVPGHEEMTGVLIVE
jgi:uncharacterized cupredoxin-like copper-binding protein